MQRLKARQFRGVYLKLLKPSKVLKGTYLLALSSLLVKVLSAVYRVPFQNIVGDEGFYVFQQVYPIYGIASIMALEGFPLFISKIVAEQNNEIEKRQVLRELKKYIATLSLICFSICLFGAKFIALLMGDERLTQLIVVTAFLFLLIPFLAIYRGFFQGELKLEGTASSQLVEQIFRVGIIILAAILYDKQVFTSVYQTGTWASAGGVVGGLGAILVLKKYGRKMDFSFKHLRMTTISVQHKNKKIFKRFVIEGGLICLYASVLVIFQLVDSFFLKNALVTSGMAELSAKITKGAYDRGQPLAQVGLVVSVAFATANMPHLTRVKNEESGNIYRQSFCELMKVVTVIGLAATVGLVALVPELNLALFGDGKENLAISWFVGVVFLGSMLQVLHVMAQIKYRYKLSAVALLVGILIKVATEYPLVRYFGSLGASLATLLGLGIIVSILYMGVYYNEVRVFPKYLGKVCFISLVMYSSIYYFRKSLIGAWSIDSVSRVGAFLFVVSSVVIGILIFAGLAILLKLFTKEEWALLSFGNSMQKFIEEVEDEIR